MCYNCCSAKCMMMCIMAHTLCSYVNNIWHNRHQTTYRFLHLVILSSDVLFHNCLFVLHLLLDLYFSYLFCFAFFSISLQNNLFVISYNFFILSSWKSPHVSYIINNIHFSRQPKMLSGFLINVRVRTAIRILKDFVFDFTHLEISLRETKINILLIFCSFALKTYLRGIEYETHANKFFSEYLTPSLECFYISGDKIQSVCYKNVRCRSLPSQEIPKRKILDTMITRIIDVLIVVLQSGSRICSKWQLNQV